MSNKAKQVLAFAAVLPMLVIVLGWQAGYQLGSDLAERDNRAASEASE